MFFAAHAAPGGCDVFEIPDGGPREDGRNRQPLECPLAVGLVTTGDEAWVVVAKVLGGAPSEELDLPARCGTSRTSLCHEVLSDGRLRMGPMEPGGERFLDALLGGG